MYKAVKISDGFQYAIKSQHQRLFAAREARSRQRNPSSRISIPPQHHRYCGRSLRSRTSHRDRVRKEGILIDAFAGAKKRGRYLARAKYGAIFFRYSGLRYLHRQNILHRDLKPKNIFLSAKDSIRIGDLGSCKLMKARFTRTQVGTPYYMPPEIWNRMAYDSKCDVWSLGCILYEMCALSPPFLGHDMKSLQRAVCGASTPACTRATLMTSPLLSRGCSTSTDRTARRRTSLWNRATCKTTCDIYLKGRRRRGPHERIVQLGKHHQDAVSYARA